MRGKLNGAGVIERVFVRRRREKRMSRAMMGLLGVVGALAAMIFIREMPNLRRYLRIERM